MVLKDSRFFTGIALAGFMIAVAGCQSGDNTIAGVGDDATKAPEGKILASELRAYCPSVTLREGTAFFNTYAKGGDGDASKIVYQAAITDVTRSCARADGMLTMNVAVAGKVVPGPAGVAGNVTMPIRIAVVRGDEVLYSQLHQHQVAAGAQSTQWVFSDPNVVIPDSSERDIQIFAGYDEGPPKKKAEE
ncbi:hypothetical protein GA830_09995 [Mesorhizobium sp. NBSH29]|uniref:hypothetical protein n=1 Tax=Mesorhizobium sp. NBSH29 TaxID=2654249 RepID=UPI00189672C4|nr:hypothetical protein [Mesorhizobium sp. NBSH29]QPC87034.1 hypothetical protein GA830_09995 [Mesorhizobium sp. NBSH29]